MAMLSARERSALDAFLSTFETPEAVLRRWHELDLFTNVGTDGIVIEVGRPRPAEVRALCGRHASVHRWPFPPLLEAMLHRIDGFSIAEASGGEARVVTCDVVDVNNGLFGVKQIDADEIAGSDLLGLVIGRAFHQPRVLLLESGAIVFEDDEPRQIAADLPELLFGLVDHGLTLESFAFAKEAG